MNVNVNCPACKRTRTIYIDHTLGTMTAVCNAGCSS